LINAIFEIAITIKATGRIYIITPILPMKRGIKFAEITPSSTIYKVITAWDGWFGTGIL